MSAATRGAHHQKDPQIDSMQQILALPQNDPKESCHVVFNLRKMPEVCVLAPFPVAFSFDH